MSRISNMFRLGTLTYLYYIILFLTHHKNEIKSSGLYTLKSTLNEMPKSNK